MKRFALVLSVALLAALAAPAAHAAAILRPAVTVDADVVTLGDLFDNLPGDKATIAVARAPLPGRRSVVDADWLQKTASMNGIAWRPTDVFVQAVIERAGVTVSNDDVNAEILAALSRNDVPASAEIELANPSLRIVVPSGQAARIRVRDLSYDNRTRRFSAVVEAPADQPDAQRIRVSGRVYSTVEVPFLARAISRGDVIETRDLTWQRVREDGLRRDIVIDPDQIIGMAARQTLRGGQMVSSNDIQRPLAVKRGALVTMILKSGAMSLSAQGRAIEQGSIGDIVRITNVHSNMTVEGRVEGPNLVSIAPNGGVALAN